MDLDMFRHPTTQKNIEIIKSYGHHLIEPAVGELASGLCGAGRMEEPEIVFDLISEFFNFKNTPFYGKKVMVTAGPTYEPIDPVRFIGNHSSGLMGFCIADEFARQGADVTLISGPVKIYTEVTGINRIDVVTAAEMFDECIAAASAKDIIVMAAAVADFSPANPSPLKIKKSAKPTPLKLSPTKDILAELGKSKTPGQFLAGFALETENEEKNARKKLDDKNLDMIFLNSLNDEGAGFNKPTNKVTILFSNGNVQRLPLKSKPEIAKDIVRIIASVI